MAKPVRGLPSDFSLDLPDDGPVHIGDFLDEPPPSIRARPAKSPEAKMAESVTPAPQLFRPEIVPTREERERELTPARPVQRNSRQPNVIRCQLNLTARSKQMLEELVEHVCRYSPENDARTSEVFQGIITLLHNAKDELELAELPRRGAWGSVTAKNFPGSLSEAFEKAVIRSAQRRGG